MANVIVLWIYRICIILWLLYIYIYIQYESFTTVTVEALVSKGGCKKHQVNHLGVATAQICTWSDFWGAEIVLNSRLATWTISVILATSSMVSVMFLKNIRAFTSSLRTPKNQINVTLNICKPTLLDLIIYICGPIMDPTSQQPNHIPTSQQKHPAACCFSLHPCIPPSFELKHQVGGGMWR